MSDTRIESTAAAPSAARPSAGARPVAVGPAAFYADGYRLAADLYLPADRGAGERLPAIVLCHGFGGLRGFWFPDFARFFASGGYAVLAFDHRGIGDSEGPRLSLDPFGQVADIRAALSFLETRDEVAADRMGLYGISYGGGNAVYAAAVDPRVTATVGVVGYGDGARWMKSLRREWEWVAFKKRLAEDHRRRVLTGQGGLADTSEILIRDPEAEEHEHEARARDPKRITRITLESAEKILEFKPEAVVRNIAPRPLFLIGVADDTLVPAEETLSLHAKAGEPKTLFMFPPIGHHAIYYGAELPRLLGMARDWLDTHLRRG